MDEQLLMMLDRQKEVSARDELILASQALAVTALTGILSPTGILP